MSKQGALSNPFAGINRIRFDGYFLSNNASFPMTRRESGSHPVENDAIVKFLRYQGKSASCAVGTNQADLKSNQPSIFIFTPRMLRWPWSCSQ